MSGPVLGVDIAKKKFDAALLVNGKLKHKVFRNDQEGFAELCSWLKKQGIDHVHVCMEASSTYGDELATRLHDQGHAVSIVNPARIKGFAQSELLRTKNDKVDAGLIARFCLAMHPEPWTPVPPGMRRLQALVRRIDALIGMKTQEMNRIDVTHEDIKSSVRDHIAYLDQEIKSLKGQIASHIKDNPELKTKRDLLKSIPGIGEATIAAILAELHMFEKCDRVQKIVAFIGLAPRELVSGSSVRGKPRICKMGNSRIRKALFMPALVSIQYNPVIRAMYERLKKNGKNGKVIVCAVMRKLVHIIFGILKSGKPFDPNFRQNYA
ncbi:MAG: IS110 family transposase [Syntrophorhabdaceae bacterium]|nr:IS110 family transposase [Syntrophorhabdaceae bacterium]